MLRTLVIALAFLLPLHGSARAQDAGTRRTARAEFTRGERAFDAGDPAGALAHFERAFELAPHDAVRFNLAICMERLGRIRDAVREYEAAAESTALDAATRARAAQLADEVRRRLGTLAIEGPEGGLATVDGSATCTMPCRIAVDPGAHEVRVTLGGAESIERAELGEGATVAVRFVVPEPPVEPIAEVPVVAPEPIDEGAPEPVPAGGSPGWLTGVGATVASLGVLGIAGFGAGAWIVHDQCVPDCDASTASTGRLMRDLTNVSIAVAAAGALALVIDLVVASQGGRLAGRPRLSLGAGSWVLRW